MKLRALLLVLTVALALVPGVPTLAIALAAVLATVP